MRWLLVLPPPEPRLISPARPEGRGNRCRSGEPVRGASDDDPPMETRSSGGCVRGARDNVCTSCAAAPGTSHSSTHRRNRSGIAENSTIFIGCLLLGTCPYRRSRFSHKPLNSFDFRNPESELVDEVHRSVHMAVHNAGTGGQFHAPETESAAPSRNSQNRLLLAQTPAPVPTGPGWNAGP